MIKKVQINGRAVTLKASAATPRLYRDLLGRDIFTDYEKLLNFDETPELERWDIFENIAFIMAKQADPTVPDTVTEWLDSFDGVPSVINITGDILELWNGNLKTNSEAKKKAT